MKKSDKIQQISCCEGAMPEGQKSFEVGGPVMKAKFVGTVIKQLHQLCRFVDNGFPVTPGEHCRKKSGDLDILLFLKPVRNRYRILFYKRRMIVFPGLFFQKGFEVFLQTESFAAN